MVPNTTGGRISHLVHKYYEAFASRDRKTVEQGLSDRFSFTSPLDDHIDKATFFEKCWPYGDTIKSLRVDRVFENGNEAFVRYEIEPKDGERFQNVEFVRMDGDQIVEVVVYFGALPEAE